jgi:hypothetical protein
MMTDSNVPAIHVGPYRFMPDLGSARDDTVHACRDCLSTRREEEIQTREKDHWKKGGLR